jgi:peptidoglycan/xylan/chitin deacetylase (PgdA/CDA1 family)
MRTRIEPGAVVIGYHRIAEPEEDPLGLCTSPSRFERQLEIVRAETDPISVEALVDGLERGALPPRALCVTIDDGYLDALENAAPMLAAFDVPATVFAVSGLPGEVPWWERLAAIVTRGPTLPERIELSADGNRIAWEAGAPGSSRAAAVRALHRQLLDLPDPSREAALTRLGHLFDAPAIDSSAPRLLTTEELGRLAAVPGISIGSHSVTHPRLAALPEATQRSEAEGGRRRLGELLGQPPVAFSYPNGSCTTRTHRIVAEAGFSCGFTSASGVATPRGDRFAIPRFWVGGLSPEALTRLLRHWR